MTSAPPFDINQWKQRTSRENEPIKNSSVGSRVFAHARIFFVIILSKFDYYYYIVIFVSELETLRYNI